MSSKRHQRRKSCEAKHRYETKQAASEVWYKWHGRESARVDVYHCRRCGGWHLGHAHGMGRSKFKAARQAGAV